MYRTVMFAIGVALMSCGFACGIWWLVSRARPPGESIVCSALCGLGLIYEIRTYLRDQARRQRTHGFEVKVNTGGTPVLPKKEDHHG